MMRWRISLIAAGVIAVGTLGALIYAQLSDTQTASGAVNVTSTSPDLYICEPDGTAGPDCGADDSGVTSRMLSSILWWLQEHKSKVFTVMTTNKQSAIPPELYRAGRIDSEINFTKLLGGEANKFADEYCKRLCLALESEYLHHETTYSTPHSHAEVVQMVTEVVKSKYLKTKEGQS